MRIKDFKKFFEIKNFPYPPYRHPLRALLRVYYFKNDETLHLEDDFDVKHISWRFINLFGNMLN